ncbi:neurotensin receptor type 1-like [Panonychus citri]|uniref:neurotensin receptor type 1-like n=1 Tax=Panonychus citri TaxID=50023 RepID=UPI0023072BDD|nr:neurotensin receptor type 1-like [Panonychus citri]
MFIFIIFVLINWLILSFFSPSTLLSIPPSTILRSQLSSVKMDTFFDNLANLSFFNNQSLIDSLNSSTLANSFLAECDYVADAANRLAEDVNSNHHFIINDSSISSQLSISSLTSSSLSSSLALGSSPSSSQSISSSPQESQSSSSPPIDYPSSSLPNIEVASVAAETCNTLNIFPNSTICKDPSYYAVSYRIIGTIFQGFILIIGVLGNIMVVIVVVKTRSMRTPTNCYLVSLSIADLMVLIAAVPNEIIAYYVLGDQWIWGRVGCALFIFFQYLGIDASSLSITAFTVERYIAICHPMKAQKVCTVHRAKRIILNVWLFACIYNAPWFFLTKVEPICYRSLEDSNLETCTFAWSRKYYLGYFFSDLVLFYIFPLLLSCVLYGLMARVLFNNPLSKTMGASTSSSSSSSTTAQANQTTTTTTGSLTTGTTSVTTSHHSLITSKLSNSSSHHQNHSHYHHSHHHHHHHHPQIAQSTQSKKSSSASNDSSRVQVVKMLVVIVAVFATLWLPYRALLVYNSMAEQRYMELWYLMFCKTMIFVNSAINPILYNALSVKFRRAFKRMLSCDTRRRRRHLDVPLASIHVSMGNSIRNNNLHSNTFLTNHTNNANNIINQQQFKSKSTTPTTPKPTPNNNNINSKKNAINDNSCISNTINNNQETNSVDNLNCNIDENHVVTNVDSMTTTMMTNTNSSTSTTISPTNVVATINSSNQLINGPKILRFTVQHTNDSNCKQTVEAL